MLGAHLSKELKAKYHKRAIRVRKGDVVKIVRGNFKGKSGKISKVDTKKMVVYIEGIQRTRKDGTKVNGPFNPSNLVITEINLEDKKRMKKISRGGK